MQAWIPRERIEAALSGGGARPVALATALGAASSSCSYAAVAIAKSLFQKGASAASALAFQFASTNLVWELGLVLWILIGWQFALAEFVGGLVMIALMAISLRAVRLAPRSRRRRASTRRTPRPATSTTPPAPTSVARAAALGRGVVGRRAQLPRRLADALEGDRHRLPARRIHRPPADGLLQRAVPDRRPAAAASTIENVLVGPLIAVLSFVCSVGNVPLAAVLWSGGICFAGVIAFIFADLIVLPIVRSTASTTGRAFALRITALMLVDDGARRAGVDGAVQPVGPRPRHAARRATTSSAPSGWTTSSSST